MMLFSETNQVFDLNHPTFIRDYITRVAPKHSVDFSLHLMLLSSTWPKDRAGDI
jgi:hypothetical protein